jgi:peptidyl-prolyl cis-trans isomerase C
MKREWKIKFGLMILSYVLVIGSFAAVPFGYSDMKKETEVEANKVVAKINGKPIYEEQLKPEVESGLRKFRKYGMRKESPELVKRLQLKALDKVIDQELIYQESRKLTIENLEEKVERRLQAKKKKYGSQKRFEKYLKVKHLTIEDLRESLKTSVYINEYLKKQGIIEPEIAEERIRNFYEDNPDNYAREESVKVSHILIKVDENANPAEKETAREKTEQIRKEIIEGQDFGEMAKKHSDCNSASGGGSLRYIKKGYMPQEFDKVAFAMEADAVSAVVETKFGYHLIKVADKKPGGIVPYEEVKDFIKKFLQQEESKKKLHAHMTELKKKAKIDILLNES